MQKERRRNTDGTHTEHRPNEDKTQTEHRPNEDRMQTERRRNANGTNIAVTWTEHELDIQGDFFTGTPLKVLSTEKLI